jgi:DHA2 family methylenomycin A resistance protein-like MFS transporter
MTLIAMGLGYAMSVADPTILSANMSQVRIGLGATTSTASFIASLATLTMAAAVLGAGTLGDLYGMRRMFAIGLFGTIAFGVLAAAAASSGQTARRDCWKTGGPALSFEILFECSESNFASFE